jgi:hypothetical protein
VVGGASDPREHRRHRFAAEQTGMANPARGSVALGTVPPDQAGVGSGVNNTALQVGIAGGIAALGAIFQSRVHSVLAGQLAHLGPQLGRHRRAIAAQLGSGDPSPALRSLPPALRGPVGRAMHVAFVSGFDRILWVAAAVALAGAVLTVALVRGRDFEAPRA